MSNIISFHSEITPDDDLLVMSNGGTNVFISVLALSGAEIAETESEKRLMVYLSERDQITGMGQVGFSITEMPWDRETFEADKAFLLRVIDGARNKAGWDSLDHDPNAELIFRYLEAFELLIQKMTMDDISENFLDQWLSEADTDDPIYRNFPRCKKHGTFLTCFGCQICNN